MRAPGKGCCSGVTDPPRVRDWVSAPRSSHKAEGMVCTWISSVVQ